MKKLICLAMVMLLFFVLMGCEFLPGNPKTVLQDFREVLIRGVVHELGDLFKPPCTIKAEIFNCPEEEEFLFETDLEAHFEDFFDEVDVLDVTIQDLDVVEHGDGKATATAIWYMKWEVSGDEEEQRDSWDATFTLEKVNELTWKIIAFVFEDR